MAAPNIKVHLVPQDYDPNLDINDSYQNRDLKIINSLSSVKERECRLIEMATNDRWTNIGNFSRRNLIKLIQDEDDVSGKTFIIDYSTEQTGYSDFANKCNWIYCADPINNPSVFSEEEWVMHHGEYSEGIGIIQHLHHQIFINKSSNFVGVVGSSSGNITIPYTYIPQVGSYSFNYNDFDKDILAQNTQINQFTFIGDIYPVYQSFNTEINEQTWNGPLHYTYKYENGKNKIIFSTQMFERTIRKFPGNPSDLSVNEVYFRGHVYRTNNIHSGSSSGINQTNSTAFYAIAHDDIVAQQTPSLRLLDASDNVTTVPAASYYWDQGIIGFNYPNVPATGNKLYFDSYTYHSWIRLTNDMTSDLLFRTYIKDTLKRIEIYNSDDNSDPEGNKGQIDNSNSYELQIQQQTVNYTWADIKITNEVFENISDPPNLLSMYIDAFPRGNLSGPQDNEQIISGGNGLLEQTRPWDHQEGARIETDKACFIRPVRDYKLLYNKPNEAPNNQTQYINVLYNNPMKQMNVAQAWQIKKWYNNNTSSGESGKRFLLENQDDVMQLTQTGSAITMQSGSIMYARIIHLLWDGINKVTVASAPKYWSIGIKGDYIEGGLA